MSQIELPVVDHPGPPDGDSPDRFHEECGVVGVWNHAEAARLAYLGLYALPTPRAGSRRESWLPLRTGMASSE